MKIYITKAVLLLLISGSTDGFSAPNTPAPNNSDKPGKHISDLRRLGNTPQPSAFKAKIPFLHGLEAPSATAPLIPKRNTLDPRVNEGHRPGMGGPPMHGAPMGGPPMHHGGPPMHHGGPPMHHGGPPMHHGGPPMGHPMHQGGPPMGHPMHGPPGHSDMGPPNGQWGMPDMLRGAPGSNDVDSDHYDHPVQGDGDGYWQSKYGDNMQAASNPFVVPGEFLDAPMDPYGDSRSEYKPMFPDGENPYEEIGAGYEPNTHQVQQPNKEKKPNLPQEKKPNMPRMEQQRMPPMEEYPNAEQPSMRQERRPNIPQEQQPNMRQEQHREEYFNAQHMPIENFPRASDPNMRMPPMEEYAQDQGDFEGEGRYSEELFHHQEQGPQEMYGEPYPHHEEQAPQAGSNVWPYNVSPNVEYEGNGFVSLEDPSMVSHPPMHGNEFYPMGDPNMMMNQRPMSGHEFVPMGDPNMMMSHHGRPMHGNGFAPMEDPNMMRPPQGYPMNNDYHPMNDFPPPMEEYGMYGDPYAHEEPVYHQPFPLFAAEPFFHQQQQQQQQQPRSQDEWYRQQSGLDRGHNTF